MDPHTAHARRADLALVDVREQWEWDAGAIEESRHVPLGELPAATGDLPTDKPLLVVCRSGQRSALAAEFLAANGFEAHNLDGGLKAWAAAGLPLAGRVV